MIQERLKFYANLPDGTKNKFHCFNVSLLSLEEALKRFLINGYHIKAAWHEAIDNSTGEIKHNLRIKTEDMQRLFDDAIDEENKAKRKVSKTVEIYPKPPSPPNPLP